jgi:hypothetical protein
MDNMSRNTTNPNKDEAKNKWKIGPRKDHKHPKLGPYFTGSKRIYIK